MRVFELRPAGSKGPYTRFIATSLQEAARAFFKAFPTVELVEVG